MKTNNKSKDLEFKTLEEMLLERGTKIAKMEMFSSCSWSYYDLDGIVFCLEDIPVRKGTMRKDAMWKGARRKAAIVIGRTESFIKNVKQEKIKFIELI